MVDWLDPDDAERLMGDPEQVDAWMARQLAQAPARDAEHYRTLARAAGFNPASEGPDAEGRTDDGHEPPELPRS
jgi:hypothetical protein